MVGGIIMRETKKWEESEIEFIRNNYTELTDYEMADQLGRTFRSVRVKRERLGLFRYFQEDYSPIKGEKWKELNGVYISNKGRVKKSDSKFLKIHVHKTGYAIVSFNGKNRYVHNLVWEAFVGKIPDDMEIDHIDCNKLNNSLYNLELVTHQENMRRAYHNNCFNNFFGREPLTTISKESTPKQVEVPSTLACNDEGEDIV